MDTGADTSIADERFLRSIGLKRKDLKKTLGSRIRGATQNYFKQLGTITLRLWYGGNVVKDTITIVDGHLVVPVLVRWNSTAALRNDLTYPASLNQVKCSTGIEEYSCGENPQNVEK